MNDTKRFHPKRYLAVLLAAAVALFAATASIGPLMHAAAGAPDVTSVEKERQDISGKAILSNPFKAGRSMSMSRHGMVATSHVLSSLAGVGLLRSGGNAVDAAIAAAATLSVVEPMMTGPGGDVFILYYDAKSKRVYGLNGTGRSPRGLTREHFGSRNRISFQGWESVSVPGAVSAWMALHERFGSKPLDEIFEPAIRHAEEGFAVTEIVSSIWGGVLQADEWAKKAWTIDGKAPRPGQLFKNPYIAKAFRLIVEGGHDAFYKGPIAKEIVRWSQESGGFFSMADFELHEAQWVDPISTNYRGYEIYQHPPNSQGVGALMMHNILEGYDLSSMTLNSPEYLHLLIESKKQAYADLAKYVADPEGQDLPVAWLLSEEYAENRRKLIDPSKAMPSPEPGQPTGSDTIYMAVVDEAGNAVSLVNSQYMAWGANVSAGSMGFTLQNRGYGFTLEKGHFNEYAPGKRPFHTLMAGMVTKDDSLYMSYGLMGGDMQPQGHLQILLGHLDFGLTIQETASMPRWRHTGGKVYLEYGTPPETVQALRAMGHDVKLGNAPLGGYGGAQIVMIDPATGSFLGASDPRKDGAAIGY